MSINKTCRQCSNNFVIEDADSDFYKKISPTFVGQAFEIPTPALCPLCRWQRRICFRNERNLYHRKCDLSGKEIISMYPESVSFPVYHIDEWFSDKWCPLDYGIKYDESKTFFEQFKALSDKVPRFHAFVDPTQSENSEYTNQSINLKDCYLVAVATNDDNCFYSRGIHDCKDCCDCLRVNHLEMCYECINSADCYHCFFVQDSSNSSDCYFSSDLRGCKYCFGCHNLQQKQYYIYNKSVSKEEWQKFIGELVLNEQSIAGFREASQKIRLSVPHRFSHLLKCENCSGDHLIESKNSHYCFNSRELENCAYCSEMTLGAKDCQDFSMTGKDCELVYEAMGCGYSTKNSLFLINCRQNVNNLIYCENCFPQVKNCFGCISLKNAQYCILNKQYSQDEYEDLVAKIITKMQNDNEWGEFFPSSFSPFKYNKTLANDYFPADRSEAEKLGMGWQEEENIIYSGPTVEVYDIDECINSEDRVDDLLSGVVLCKESLRPFKINSQELSFYIKHKLPIPALHPDVRYRNRLNQCNPYKLYHRKCMNEGCKNEFETTYAPDRPEKVYCASCHQKTVL